MRWDPIKEAIDDFAYRYKELGLSLGLQQDSIFDNFKACIPGQYFVFVYNANDMAQAVDNLKKCIAAGPHGIQHNNEYYKWTYIYTYYTEG